jgi:hypothetical protein
LSEADDPVAPSEALRCSFVRLRGLRGGKGAIICVLISELAAELAASLSWRSHALQSFLVPVVGRLLVTTNLLDLTFLAVSEAFLPEPTENTFKCLPILSWA